MLLHFKHTKSTENHPKVRYDTISPSIFMSWTRFFIIFQLCVSWFFVRWEYHFISLCDTKEFQREKNYAHWSISPITCTKRKKQLKTELFPWRLQFELIMFGERQLNAINIVTYKNKLNLEINSSNQRNRSISIMNTKCLLWPILIEGLLICLIVCAKAWNWHNQQQSAASWVHWSCSHKID